MAPYFYNVVDDDSNEAVRGPFMTREDALESADESDLDVSRNVYKSLSKSSAERSLRGGGSRMQADQVLPELPQF